MKTPDDFLANEVKENECENSLVELIGRHSNLCYNICQKYMPVMHASGIFLDDVLGDKDYIIYHSAKTFDPTRKTKFSTWLGNQVRYHCLNKINKNKKYVTTEDQELSFLIDKDGEKENTDELKDYITNLLSKIKDKRIKQIFQFRYFSDEKKMTWTAVAKKINVSSQTAINLHNRGLSILKKRIKKEAAVR
jgi:RNA polymerase sigma factor (sigma-70 family)|tara:strand:- start:271 stop:846 length:576 start_codon:yes stop_codon:yes gene_type:complete